MIVSCKTDSVNPRVKIVTFGDPSEQNAIHHDVFRQLAKTFEEIAKELDKVPGAVILSPSPFEKCMEDKKIVLRQSVGAKLDSLIDNGRPHPKEYIIDYIRLGLDTISGIRKLVMNENSPIAVYGIAAGEVLGGSVELFYGISDFILIGESTTFQFPEIGLNFIPGWGGPYYLKSYINDQRIKYLTTGNKIDARTACEWGMAIGVYPDNDVEGEALKLARKLAARNTEAVYNNLKVPSSPIPDNDSILELEKVVYELMGRQAFADQVMRYQRIVDRKSRV